MDIQSAANDALDDTLSLTAFGLMVKRLPTGEIVANVPHAIKYHSPTGFEIGYGGSGPAELALNVLHVLLPPTEADLGAAEAGGWSDPSLVGVSHLAFRLHQAFKWDFIAPMDTQGGCIEIAVIRSWIASQRAALAVENAVL